jgi:hypothetical protein
MRNFFCLVLCAFSSGLSNADVVITGIAGSGNAYLTGAGQGYNYKFQTGDASQATSTTGSFWSLSSLKLKGSANHDNGDWTIRILDTNGFQLATQSFNAATSNGSGVTTFAFTGSMTTTLLNSATVYSIEAVYNGNGAGTFGAEINAQNGNNVTYDTTQPSSAQFSNFLGSTVGGAGNVGLFEINASAVPEPGTLLLGGIAAACGGTGVWWKRRKRQPQAETTEQPAAI